MNTPQVLILIARARECVNVFLESRDEPDVKLHNALVGLYDALPAFDDVDVHLIPCIGGQVVPVTSSPDPYAGRNRPGRVGILDL